MAADKTIQLEKYTNDAKQVVTAAQQLADEQKHAEFTPLHLLARLLERDRGVLEIFRKAGADPNEVRDLSELSLRRMPKEPSGVAYVSSRMMDLLGRAERGRQEERARDSPSPTSGLQSIRPSIRRGGPSDVDHHGTA